MIRALAQSQNPGAREVGQAMLEAISECDIKKTDAELRYPFAALADREESGRLLSELKCELPCVQEWWYVYFLEAAPNYLRRCLVAYNRSESAFVRTLIELLVEAAVGGMLVERARGKIMRTIERLATYWLLRLILADVFVILIAAVIAVAGLQLWRDLCVLVGR